MIVKRIFYGGFSVCLLTLLIIVMRYPQNNLIPAKMFLYTLIWVSILCAAGFFLSSLEALFKRKGVNLEKISRVALMIYVVIYGIMLYIVSLVLRSEPVTDYGSVYNTALCLASGQPVQEWEYFSTWGNNVGTLTILSFCMRLGVGLGFSDPYYFVLFLNVIYVAATLLSVFYLAGRTNAGSISNEKRIARQWLALCIFTLWTPVWANTNGFYSDQLSFGGGVIAAALLLMAGRLNGWRKGLLAAAAGMIWGTAIAAKSTAAVGWIAVLIAVTCCRQWKQWWKRLLLSGTAMLLTIAAFSLIGAQYPSKADESRLKAPLEYWFALGLLGDGTYGDNMDFIQEFFSRQNAEEKKEYCRQVIRENRSNFFEREHLVRKTSVIFGTGEIAPINLSYPYKESVLWHFFYWTGDYYWKYACLATSFFFAVLFLMLVGTFLRTLKKREESWLVFACYLTVFGMFLFLMLWEAQNKQFYNLIPWMTLAVVSGLDFIKPADLSPQA